MAGGGGHGAHNITYGGLNLHTTKGWHSRVGQGMCAIMWFWVLYRAKQDGPVLMMNCIIWVKELDEGTSLDGATLGKDMVMVMVTALEMVMKRQNNIDTQAMEQKLRGACFQTSSI